MGKLKYRPVFYIAHTFSERYFVRDELIPAIQKLGCVTLNPFYEADGSWKSDRPEIRIADEGNISMPFEQDNTVNRKWVKTVKSRSVNIVETDLNLINEADGVIAYMPEGSTGTTCEIWYCGGVFKYLKKLGYELPQFQGKVTYLIASSSRLHMHPWIKYATKGVFKNHKEFLKYLRKAMPRLRQKLKDRREKIAK